MGVLIELDLLGNIVLIGPKEWLFGIAGLDLVRKLVL